MAAGKGKTPERADPGWRYPVDIADEFRRWCDGMGYRYETEAAAAIYLWSRLGPDVREKAKKTMKTKGRLDVDLK